jgi:hypothetical protein
MPDHTALAAAYRATAYRFGLDGETIELRVGASNAALDRWLAAHGFAEWAWLTAVNPGSRQLPEAENRKSMNALAQQLAAEGLLYVAGAAVADRGDWPDEASFFVPGIEAQKAGQLARAYGQNAFLYGKRGLPACLLWVAAEAS